MTFQRIEGEPRLTVASQSDPSNWYVIDLDWQEHEWSKPKVACGCVRGLMGQDCIHIRLIKEALKPKQL